MRLGRKQAAIHELRLAAANVNAVDKMFRAHHDAGDMTDEQYRLAGEMIQIVTQRIARQLRWSL